MIKTSLRAPLRTSYPDKPQTSTKLLEQRLLKARKVTEFDLNCDPIDPEGRRKEMERQVVSNRGLADLKGERYTKCTVSMGNGGR